MKRWWIGLLIGFGILINYFDRTNLSVAQQPISDLYHLSSGQMGIILSSFGWSYALFQIPVGALLDKIGPKWLVRIGTLLWSLATLMTAVVSGMGLILLSRIILGAAEAPAFPAASKATGYWFPVRERGLATSIFDAAAKFSNVIGTPLIAWAVFEWGWKGGFWLTGVLSLVYLVLYWIFYRDPKDAKLSQKEAELLREGGAQEIGTAPGGYGKNLAFVLSQRKIWGLTLGFTAYGYTFYLFLTWLPGYLEKQMHMTILKSGWYTAGPWLVATLTDLIIGGWLVDHLVKRGHDSTRVRKTILVIGMILGLAVIPAAFTNNANVAVIFIAIALGGLAFSAPIGWSIPSLISPRGTVGTVGSVINFFNNLMSIAAPIVTGYVVQFTGSFESAFIIAGIVLILGILCYVLMLGKIEPIRSPFEDAEAAK
ncbi:MFS transporter [Alicyclobacillus acidoterrestris]|uniref:MFS transporter n=1 Tax=Alicyclobacillus acidoterrestris (strain ATCC 49025 / DSM 3922 / CIP 106132 / NCIMB 13137 / GD3B) TaxID=1356854 RepID=T0BEW0_ALIAG|nr:MFS transporter [Alicyclobacillus acidoterrestris]EPZ42518.1 MFS transporter [Alicyclobacillus acidoterrestris ATCC 49025]UNO49468.1 MFS transporter [Alicyclobacillus acidoterrestris]